MGNTLAAVEHLPVAILSPDGEGVRSTVGCSCGDRPTRGAASMNTMHSWMNAHTRKHGAPRPDYSQTRYAPEYPAAGMTWNEWNATHPGADPFGIRASTITAADDSPVGT